MELKRVIEIINEVLEKKGSNIIGNEKLQDDLGICSFDMMVIITLVERDGFRVDIDKLARNLTVEGLLKAITKEV